MALTVYVAPASRGTGDGSTAANAHSFSSLADMTWLTGVMTVWRAELDADPDDVGLNQPHTISTVAPGLEPGYNEKSYITATKHGVWVRRVCWLSDVGEYTFGSTNPGTGPWFSIAASALPALPAAGVGDSPADPIRRVHFVAYRNSDGLRADQVAGGTTTRTKTVAGKATGANRTLSANYTAADSAGVRRWTGATETKTLTWTVSLPSPIRAVIRGNRTPDPRTDKTTQQWCASTTAAGTFELRDPNGTVTEPYIVDGSGVRRVVSQGQVYNSSTGAITTPAWTSQGAHIFSVGGSCIGFQGFEARDVQSLVTHAGTPLAQYQSFLDIRLDNTRYCQNRGDLKSDVEFARVQATSVSQAMWKPGQHCQRWHIRDVVYDGQLIVGDRFQGLFGAANGPSGTETAHNAGPVRFERIIVERVWDATPPGQTYMNGDGVDAEVKGLAIRDFYVDLAADGGIDTKATPYWVNWPATIVCNAWLGRTKRAYRSWPGAQIPAAVAPHILRDVVIADSRQYGVFLVGQPGHHKHVDWHNPDGRANFANPAGRTYTAVSNDNNVGGDMDVVIRQFHDARTVGNLSSGLNTNTVRGKTAAPFRARIWTPLTVPSAITVAVDGATVDDGAARAVPAGQTVTITPSGQPAGTVYDYTLSGPGTITRDGDSANITPTV